MQIKTVPQGSTQEEQRPSGWTLQSPLYRMAFFLGLAIIAVMIHGYHPFAEDGSIYVPAVKKLLNPDLYPRGAQFFLFPGKFSVFAALLADSVRITHLPLEYVLLLWHIGAIALLLAASHRLCRICFSDERVALVGTLLVASVLTIPVAGSSLMLFDPYLTSRSISTPLLLLGICFVLETKFVPAGFCLAAAAWVHPLMAAFGGLFMATLFLLRNRRWWQCVTLYAIVSGAVIAVSIRTYGVQVSPEYRAAVLTRTYFFLSQWTWYEWLGLVAPLVLFALLFWFHRNDPSSPSSVCTLSTIWYGIFFLILGLAISRTGLPALARYQPMRSFHLIYLLLFLLPVNIAVCKLTSVRLDRLVLLLLPVCALMFLVQRETFPAEVHAEWPWLHRQNAWAQAFEWVRQNTPENAVFALDSRYMDQPAEDHQGFRAVAERSSLADRSKDGGVAALFPDIAPSWAHEMAITSGLKQMNENSDWRPLVDSGANWLLVRSEDASHLKCAYQNAGVAVCQLGEAPPTTLASHRWKRKPAPVAMTVPTPK